MKQNKIMLDELPKEVLLEQERMLDADINTEVDKVKMTSDFVSTLKKLEANTLLEVDEYGNPLNVEENED